MATQSVIHPVPLQKSAVIPIESPSQVIPIAEPINTTIRRASVRAPGVRRFCSASQSTMNPQAKVALEKQSHPERFCPFPRCLWRTAKLNHRTGDRERGGYCPRHRGAVRP